MTILAPELAGLARPGQFCALYMPKACGFMLPRPLSIFSADSKEGAVSFFYRTLGRGTNILSRLAPGHHLKVLGPLGNGFPAPQEGALFIAGGMGIAPLNFLSSQTKTSFTLLHAAQKEADLAYPGSVPALGEGKYFAATEDGSRGFKGNAVEAAAEFLPAASQVFACGPAGLLQALAKICRQNNLAGWLSLEEKMACAIGACRGCVTATTQGYLRVCHDGPVFSASEVYLDA